MQHIWELSIPLSGYSDAAVLGMFAGAHMLKSSHTVFLNLAVQVEMVCLAPKRVPVHRTTVDVTKLHGCCMRELVLFWAPISIADSN